MQVGADTVESIQLSSFEEAVTAFAAVQAIYGEEHPLLQATHRIAGQGASLWNEIDQLPVSARTVFEGEDAAVIKDSLEAVAQPESPSLRQSTARMMLDTMLHDSSPVSEVSAPSRLEQAPRFVDGLLIESPVRLARFGHLVTALQSVEDFAEGEALQATSAELRRAIDEADPFDTQPVIYWGSKARVIHGALVKAANRRIKAHDISAAGILEESGNESMADTIVDQTAQYPLSMAA